MNKIFKVIWNHATQSWVAVSELQKAKGKTASKTDKRAAAGALVGFMAATVAGGAYAATTTGSGGIGDSSIYFLLGNQAPQAIGDGANSISIGNRNAWLNQKDQVLIGMNVHNQGQFGDVAVGNKAIVGGGGDAYGTSVGYNAQSYSYSTAIGAFSNADIQSVGAVNALNKGSIAVGTFAHVNNADSGTALGSGTRVGGSHGTAIGSFSASTRENATGIGNEVMARGVSSVAIGDRAMTGQQISNASKPAGRFEPDNAIAVGTQAAAISANSISLGTGSIAGGYDVSNTDLAGTMGGTPVNRQDYLTKRVEIITTQIATAQTEYNNALSAFNADDKNSDKAAALAKAAAKLKSLQDDLEAAERDTTLTLKQSANNATAIGYHAKALADNTVALGVTANATGKNAMAQGVNANASAVSATAIGINSVASAENATAIAGNATASGVNSIAFGVRSIASKLAAVALGEQAKAEGEKAIAIGNQANASEKMTVAIGDLAKATAEYGFAAGAQANASVRYATALGANSNATNEFATAVGKSALASGRMASAVGVEANATGANAAAFGSKANAAGASGVAIGNGAVAGRDATTGANAVTALNNAIAIGTGAKSVGGHASIAFGNGANATQNNAIATGTNANVTAAGGIAMGQNSNVSATNAIAFGVNATVAAGFDRAVALGAYATVSAAVPTSSATVRGITYDGFKGATPEKGDVVSVGDAGRKRQIQNVAAGQISAESTDAINGSQLFAVLDQSKWKLSTSQDDASKQDVGDINLNDEVIIDGKGVIKVTNTKESNNVSKVHIAVETQAVNSNADGKADTSGNSQTGGTANNAPNLTALATAGDVINAVNNSFWKVSEGTAANKKDDVKAGDNVVFANGTGTVANVTTSTDGTTTTVKYDIDKGDIQVDETTGAVTQKPGEGDNKVATTADVVDAINKSGFKLKASATAEGTEEGSTLEEEVINPSETVEIVAGKNLKVKQDDKGKITLSTKDDVTFTNVNATNLTSDTIKVPTGTGSNPITINKDGIDMANKPITNVNNDLTTYAAGTPTAGLVDLSKPSTVADSTVATVGDLRNMGWVVSSDKTTTATEGQPNTNVFNNQVKNAGEVKFVGTGAAKVSGTTQGDTNVITVHVDPSQAPTTAQISTNTTTGKAGTGADGSETAPNPTALATAGDVINAVNNSFWKVSEGTAANKKDDVKAGDNVVFANGTGTVANVTTSTDGTTTTVKYDIDKGDIQVDENTGAVSQPANEGDNKVATTGDVVDAISKSGFNLTAQGKDGSIVNPGETVDLNNTDGNIKITKSDKDNNVTFNLNNTVKLGDAATNPTGSQLTIDGDKGVISGLNTTLQAVPNNQNLASPTISDAQKTQAATLGDVLNAGWNLKENDTAKDFVKAYDTVNFVNGTGTTANVSMNNDGTVANVTFNVNNTTLSVNEDVTKADAGKVAEPSADDANKFVTAGDLATAMNKTGFTLKTSATGEGEKDADSTDPELINAGDVVDVEAGKNIKVKQSKDGKITVSTKDDVTFNNVTTTKGLTVGEGTTATRITPTDKGLNFSTNNGPTVLGGVTSGLDTIKTGNPAGLLDLSNPTAVPNNTAATVGDLRNMGWVVSSDKTTTATEGQPNTNAFNNQVKNAGEVKFVGTGAAKVSGEDKNGTNVITVHVDPAEAPETAQISTNTTTGKAGTGADGSETAPNPTALATAGDVINAVNNSFWKVSEGTAANKKDDVKAGDNVVFANGTGTVANVTTSTDGTTTTVKYDIDKGDIQVDETTGAVSQPANEGDNKVATTGDVVDAISKSGFKLTAQGKDGSIVNPGETVDLNNTDGNIKITKSDKDNNVTFNLNNTVKLGDAATNPTGSQLTIDGDKGVISGLNTTLQAVPNNQNLASPTISDAQKTQAATLGDVLNAGWNLKENDTAKDFVKAYDTVNFVNGTGTTANVSMNNDGTVANVTFNVNNTTLSVNEDVTKADAGKVAEPSADDANKFVTAGDLATAMNKAGFTLKTSASDGERDADSTGDELINAGDVVDVEAGKNIKVKQSAKGKITVSTKDSVTFTDVTSDTIKVPTGTGSNPITINKDGIDMANKPITNVNNGLTTYAAGTPTAGLVDLSKPTDGSAPKVADSTVATVGDLRNMGWVVSSDKTTGDLGTAYNDQVKNANEVKFVGTNLATVSGKTENGVRTITVDVNAQNTVNSAQLPVVYTTADGTRVVKANDGKFYPADEVEADGTPKATAAAKEVAPKDVIASMNSGSDKTNEPTALANVKGNLEPSYNKGNPEIGADGKPTTTTAAAPSTSMDAPTADDVKAMYNNAATVGDVLNAGWNLKENDTAKDFVKAYDTVNFVNGTGTTANVSMNNDGTVANVTFNVNNTTLTVNEDVTKADAGKVAEPSADDANKFVTAGDLATAMNKTGFTLKTSATTEGEKDADSTDPELINAGDVVDVEAGKNIKVKQSKDGKITVSTRDSVTFTDVTSDTIKVPTGTGSNPITINKDGIDMANKPITNVNNGLTTYAAGTPTAGLVDLSKPTDGSAPKVADSTVATVGDLRNMGWVVSSDKTTGDLGTAYNDQVKNANEVKFVGTNLATVSGKTENGVRTITVDVNAQNTVNSAQLPVVYTTADGTRVVKANDGKFYPADEVEADGTPKATAAAKEVAPKDVIASMNSGSDKTNEPTTLANVKSHLPSVNDTAKTVTPVGGVAAPAEINKAPLTAQQAAELAQNSANHAATLGDVLNAGWNLQANGSAVDFVRPFDTINFKDGANTKVVAASDDGVTSELAVNVVGLPVSYTTQDGVPVAKVGDTFYEMKEDGTPDLTKPIADPSTLVANAINPTAKPNEKGAPITLGNIKSGVGSLDGSNRGDDAAAPTAIDASSPLGTALKDAYNGLADLVNAPQNNAVTAADLRNLGWVVSATGNDYADDVRHANEVRFIGNGLAKVEGKTTADGVREITVSVETGAVVPTQAVDNAGNPVTKVGDKYYKTADIDPATGKPKAGVTEVAKADVTETPNSGAGLVTGNQVADAIQTSGFVIGKQTDTLAAADFKNEDERVNPDDNVRFADGNNTNVKLATKETTDASGKKVTTTTVKVDVTGLPISYTDENGTPVVKVGDKFFTVDAEGNPTTNEVPKDKLSTNLVNATAAPNEKGEPTKLGNVADGKVSPDSKDAVNGSQLYAVGDATANMIGGGAKANPTTGAPEGFSKDLNTTGGTATTADYKPTTPATNVADAIDNLNTYVNAGWKIGDNDGKVVERIAPNDQVNFVDSNTISAKVEANNQGGANVSFEIKTGTLGGNNGGTSGSGGFVTANQVADAINKSGFNLKTSAAAGGDKVSGSDELINPTDNVEMIAGKNLTVKQEEGGKVTFATAENVTFTTVNSTTVVVGDPNDPNKSTTLTSGNDGLNVGGDKITGVAAGDISADSTDAVNGSQIYALTGGAVTNVGDVTVTNPDGTTSTVENVILDKDGKPALVTYNVKGQAEHIQNSVISAINHMNTQGIKFFHTNDGKEDTTRPKDQRYNSEDSSASGKYASAMGYQAEASGESSVAMGNNATASGANAIAIGVNSQATGKNTISVGNNIVKGDNSYSAGNNNEIASGQSDVFALGNNVKNTASNSVFLGSESGVFDQAGATRHATTGVHIAAAGSHYTFRGENDANVAGKDNAVGVVSVGNATATRQVQGVAAGVVSSTSTDAINGSQLYYTNKAIGDMRGDIYNLGNTINKANRDLRAGIAGSNAAAGLPQVYIPGKSMVAASAGTFRGEGALAVGYSRASDNGKLILKLQGNTNTRGDIGGSVGMGYQW